MFYLKESHKADQRVFKKSIKVVLGIVLFLIFANGILGALRNELQHLRSKWAGGDKWASVTVS